MQGSTNDPKDPKKSSKLVTHSLKLHKIQSTNPDNIEIKYVKKDGNPREFKLAKVISLDTNVVVIQTKDLEFKRLLIENITDIIEHRENKDAKKQA
jgi:hypothetical protein